MTTSINTNVSGPNPNVNTEVVGSHSGRITYNGVSMSVLQAVSMLFIERAQTYSSLVSDRLESAKGNLNNIQEARHFLQELRNRRSNKNEKLHNMPEGLQKFCEEHHIAFPEDVSNDGKWSDDELDTIKDNVQGGLDNMQDTNQMEMMHLKNGTNNLDTSMTAASKVEEKAYGLSKDIVSALGR